MGLCHGEGAFAARGWGVWDPWDLLQERGKQEGTTRRLFPTIPQRALGPCPGIWACLGGLALLRPSVSLQLKALGALCGLVSEKGPDSEDLNRTVDLLAGLGAERPETGT